MGLCEEDVQSQACVAYNFDQLRDGDLELDSDGVRDILYWSDELVISSEEFSEQPVLCLRWKAAWERKRRKEKWVEVVLKKNQIQYNFALRSLAELINHIFTAICHIYSSNQLNFKMKQKKVDISLVTVKSPLSLWNESE